MKYIIKYINKINYKYINKIYKKSQIFKNMKYEKVKISLFFQS